MTEAKATVKHSILQGIVQQWHKKDDEAFAFILQDSIMQHLFDPATRGAVEEYIEELRMKDNKAVSAPEPIPTLLEINRLVNKLGDYIDKKLEDSGA